MEERKSLERVSSAAANLPSLIKKVRAFAILSVLVVGLAFALASLPTGKRRQTYSVFPTAATAHAAELNPWTLAIKKVREDRGEPTGKQAKVEIPSQLRHYSDTRRFLAIQVAEVNEHDLKTPQDLVDLAAMIKSGEMVTLNPVTDNYVLIGVGGLADRGPFTRYEQPASVDLFDEAGLRQEYARLAESKSRLDTSLAASRKELGTLKRRERSRRNELQAQVSSDQKALKQIQEAKSSLDSHYASAEDRARLFGNYASIASLAITFPDRNFNVADPAQRRDLKVRLLSSLRPEALKVMNEIAESYSEKFDRPLPITSLVRPDEYQHTLSKTNPNATRIETPPHSTGLAFDIFYRFMTAEEQAHVMSHLADLERQGRIEVLRENRDHYHVFAFADGKRPGESLVAASLGVPRVARPAVESHHPSKRAAAKKKAVKPAARKKTTRKRR